MNYRESAEHIFLSAIRGVLPEKLIGDLVSIRGSILHIGYNSFDLQKYKNIYVIGAGKASAALGHYLENAIGERITGGHIITKYGFCCRLKRIKVTEAGHPVPDENSFISTGEIVSMADAAAAGDLVICLWSGGGSSLLSDYPAGSSATGIMFLNDMLVRCGAGIDEINIVRKHVSGVKGGQLARHIWPAECITIYLSDVTGDHPDTVASGPTVPDNSTFDEALAVIEKYGLKSDIPSPLLDHIMEGCKGIIPDTPKKGDPIFGKSFVIMAGNNMMALKSAAREAEKLDLPAFIVTPELAGETEAAANRIIDTIHWYRNNDTVKKPVCLIFGGETTVRVTGDGMGGRNQHLALTVSSMIRNIPGITFLSAGTDGNDGNTEMAGAVVDSETYHYAMAMNADIERYLAGFDSYSFFKYAGGHIFTGPTMTNVMDIAIVIIA